MLLNAALQLMPKGLERFLDGLEEVEEKMSSLSVSAIYLPPYISPSFVYLFLHSFISLTFSSFPSMYLSILQHPLHSISLCYQETRVQSLSQEDPLEKETAAHFRTVAWEEEPCQATVHGVAKESDTTE